MKRRHPHSSPCAAIALAVLLLGALPVGCATPNPPAASAQGAAPKRAPKSACPKFKKSRGKRIQDERVDEVSGIAAATSVPGALWAHNDSGDEPRLFLISWDGSVHGTVQLRGAKAVDWEDMAAAQGPDGQRELWIGDIGDNNGVRASVQLYRIAEPGPEALGGEVSAVRFDVKYPDGAEDAEALFVDPKDAAVYIVGKVALGSAPVYRVRPPRQPTGTLMAEEVASLRVRFATAADMAPDRSAVVVRTYNKTYLWQLPEGASLLDTLNDGSACKIKLPKEPQSEAIAFADPFTLLSLSEKTKQPVYVLRAKRPGVLP